MDRDTRIPKSRRQVAVEDDKTGDEISHSIFPLVTTGGLALSESEKAKTLADSLEAQF